MARKPITLRQAVIATAALAAGSTAGTVAEAAATYCQNPQPELGKLVAALTTLWTLDKLNRLIDHTK